jgi:hypothetical protein
MTYAMLYAEDSSVVGTYETRDDALRALVSFVHQHPKLQDDIGLRPYENGRPAGDFQPASELVGDVIAQPHLL